MPSPFARAKTEKLSNLLTHLCYSQTVADPVLGQIHNKIMLRLLPHDTRGLDLCSISKSEQYGGNSYL